MDTISREELKKKLDGQEDLKLVMVLGERAFRTMRIPGSVHLDNLGEALEALDPDDDIVVYDSNPRCVASLQAYRILKNHGYRRVRRYAGGLEDWEEAGYPLEGEFFGRRSRPEAVGLDASRTTRGSDQNEPQRAQNLGHPRCAGSATADLRWLPDCSPTRCTGSPSSRELSLGDSAGRSSAPGSS